MQQTPVRPGPRSDIDVRTEILDVAEQLFAEQGVNSPSARAIAAAAGIAPGALHYHFGGKDGVVVAVLERRGVDFSARSIELLEAIASSNRRPTVLAVVRAVMAPYLELLAEDPVGGLRWLKMLGELVMAEDLRAPILIDSATRLRPLLRTQLERALDGRLTSQELSIRAGIAIHAVLNSLRSLDAPPFAGALGPEGVDPEFVRQLAAFTAAGISGRTPSR